MTHVQGNAWYLQWYVFAGLSLAFWGFAFVWYFPLGGLPPWRWAAIKLRQRRERRAGARANARRVAAEAAARPPTIDAEPE